LLIMDTTEIFGRTELLQYIIIPALICLARVCDVTLGTIRIITLSKGMKFLATGLAFFEIIIWLFAIGQIMQNLTNIANYIAYAVGFAVGNYFGIYIEEKLSFGIVVLRIITKKRGEDLIAVLKNNGYGVTSIKADGAYGPVDVIFTIIKRKEYKTVVEIIKKFNPKAIYTVEEVKFANAPNHPIVHKDKKDYASSLFNLLVPTTGFNRRVLNKLNCFQQSNHLKTKKLKETF
jgi:uncharacterized protein YebE (UPF0316 family)